MDWLGGVFSGPADLSRVNPAGLALMGVGIAAAALAGRIAAKNVGLSPNAIKITGLVICAGGALLAILG